MTLTHDAPTARPSVAAPPSTGRTVTVSVRGVPVTVPCPDWCIGHDPDENLMELADLGHNGAAVTLPVPTFSGGTAHILGAYLAHYPFEAADCPYLLLDAGGKCDFVPLPRAAALAFADQLVAHADRLRALVGQLA